MAIHPKKAQLAKIVCDDFTQAGRGSSRHALIIAVKDSTLPDQMATQSLLRDEENKGLFFPTLGTFALLPDDDPQFLAARSGTIQVLNTLRNLFETGSPHTNIAPNELLEEAKKTNEMVDPSEFNLGIYLVDFPGLGAVQGFARDSDHIGVRFLTVSERIVMMDSPASEWERCVEICRQNARPTESPSLTVVPEPVQPKAVANKSKSKEKSWLPNGWILGRQIGEGGQGWTYKVRRSSADDDEWFVFKRLKNSERSNRFRSEIKALRALDHHGILRIIDDGTIEEKPYYIAEYCGGGDLSRRNVNGITILERLLLFRQICSAVSAAHTANIVHRDIKPSNILMRTDGSIAVGDFGLCLHLGEADRFTQTDEAVGARNYMAPELEDGRKDDVTATADVYSLGKILYFLFTGRSFSREKHRDRDYDLTRPTVGQTEYGIEFVYEILDKSIVENPRSRFENASMLTGAVDGAIRRISLNAHVLDLGMKQPCVYCVEGEYMHLQGSQTNQYSMVLVCRRCGNTQHFSPPFNGWSPWWMKR